MQLANLLGDGKLPFRPKQHGRPDGGAEEIRLLYESAFARGKSYAGYELARLYRVGFPKDRPFEAIPKDTEVAVGKGPVLHGQDLANARRRRQPAQALNGRARAGWPGRGAVERAFAWGRRGDLWPRRACAFADCCTGPARCGQMRL